MSNFPIIDLVVGLIFLYFLLSIISSSAVEIVQTLARSRAKILGQWLTGIFSREVEQPNGERVTLGQAIMDHCATVALSEKGKAPSYIDAKNFSAALIEKLTYNPLRPQNVATNLQEIIDTVNKSDALSDEVKRAFLAYAYDAQDTYKRLVNTTLSEVEYFKTRVENWYDTSMDRLTGALKRKWTQPLTFATALIVAVALNADSIAIAKYLYSNPEVRMKVAAAADRYLQDTTRVKPVTNPNQAINTQYIEQVSELDRKFNEELKEIKDANAALSQLIPLGWSSPGNIPQNGAGWFTKVIGLLATVLAIFMGAPFWFDVLNKIANLRGAGRKPPSSTGTNTGDVR